MCVGLIETRAADPLAPPRASATWSCCSARARAATASAARPCSPRAELGEGDAAKRPTVQIGDPFEEKKLLECSLELLDRGLLVALQDLGAAGLTSSSWEMAAKGERGDRPRRGPRAAARGRHGAVRDHGLRVPGADAVRRRARAGRRGARVCARWEVNATAIGEVTDSGRLRVFDGDDARGRRAGPRAGRRVPGLRARAAGAGAADLPGAAARRSPTALDAARHAARAARQRQPRLAPLGVRAVRLRGRLAHRAPARAGRRRRAACSTRRARAARRSRSRSTATAAAWRPTRTAARSRRCSSARPTSPASAPSRSG